MQHKIHELIQQDISYVSQWLHCDPKDLKIEHSLENISTYLPQIHEMMSTYAEFPEDENRTQIILNLLKIGAQPLPIYVEKNDPYHFILEGRHRIVAFYLYGLKAISVARVSSPTNSMKPKKP